VAGLQDWIALARSTMLSLESRDVHGLYSLEWPEAMRLLTSEHRRAIENEPQTLKRQLRTYSAVLYGVTKRLAPARRLLFVASIVLLVYSLFSLFSAGAPETPTYASLLASFALMTLLLSLEIIDKIKFRDELVLARELQAGLLPSEPPPFDGFEIAAYNRIANTVGGDIYDFVPISGGRLAILFGDASGHGMAAGLIMAVAHAAFRTQLDVDPSPRAVFATLNRILCRTGGRRSFFSAVYLLLEADGTYDLVIAGHPPIVRVQPDGSTLPCLGKGSYPLGIKIDCMWETLSGRIESGETFVLHSDGLTESRNLAGDFFGDERVESSMRWAAGRPAGDLLSAVIGHWRSFSGDLSPEDDVSVAVIRRVSPAAAAGAGERVSDAS
jgi:serine phosphatase RsbU (regulator of sigma subunit)